eukprot:6206803-Pleurochrysis_carterae.AAC.2
MSTTGREGSWSVNVSAEDSKDLFNVSAEDSKICWCLAEGNSPRLSCQMHDACGTQRCASCGLVLDWPVRARRTHRRTHAARGSRCLRRARRAEKAAAKRGGLPCLLASAQEAQVKFSLPGRAGAPSVLLLLGQPVVRMSCKSTTYAACQVVSTHKKV